MSDSACRSELVLRERRGELSSLDTSALAQHLAACEACRLSHRLGRDFDESAALERGDGARISALAELARRWASGGGSLAPERADPLPRRAARPAWRRRAVLLAAALPLFVAAAASAAFGVYRARTPPPEAAPVLAVASAARPQATPRKSPAREPLAAALAPEPPATAAAEAALPPRAEKPASRAPASAAERFERANAARRSGDIAQAIMLYRELERDFPASAEAAAAELRLGNLLLERGKAAAALEQFERHLRRAGALVPEALYGRGRALSALDESAGERQTWTRLLRDYAGSPYAAHAKRRLETLGRNAASTN
jgi:TolA-binding protein